jgi:lysozyme
MTTKILIFTERVLQDQCLQHFASLCEVRNKTANELFDTLLPSYERIVLNKVKRELTQNEFDALVSHTYNTGGSETLFRLVEANAPINEIKKWWTERYITASGIKLRGLVRRRLVEFELFIEE